MSELRYCVYIHTCVAEGESFGKVYIGQTSQKPEHRWGKNGRNYGHCLHFDAAIKKHGWSAFRHEIVAENLTKEDADALEIALIDSYHACDARFGFNLTRGGQSLLGADNPASRPVAVFDCETGERLADCSCSREAEEYCGVPVCNCLRGKAKTCGKYICRYADEVVGVSSLPKSERFRHRAQPMKDRPVNQYDFDGRYLRSFSSIQSAEKSLSLSRGCVGNAVRGDCFTAGGFQWRYDLGNRNNIAPIKTPSQKRMENGNYGCKPIEQIEKDTGCVVAVFPSIREAARSINGNRWNIKTALDDRTFRKTACGYKWRYHIV